MTSRMVLLAFAFAGMCTSPYASRIRVQHAQEFGCQERWVQVRESDVEGQWTATGCGFRSEWSCQERACRMRDSASYGVDAP
ncbi:hypothetical protein [Sandaracinus amylolyticus]|nr:hypothetical protein [Sandaracinus amylolyticus]